MAALFLSHIRKFASVTDKEYDDILAFFERKKVGKKEYLLREGERCVSSYFVVQGCLRKFFINDKGAEQTTEFAIEQWWMADNFAYLNHSATEFNIQAVEPSELLMIRRDALERLVQQYPLMERYFRSVYQKAYAALQMRIKFLYGLSREELYHHFRDMNPGFLQRVPQYMLASYLGITPEYLSEIRKRSIS